MTLNPKDMHFVHGFKANLDTMRILHDKGRTLVAAFDGEFQGRKIFNIRELYEQYGEWHPGKGISVPSEKRNELLQAIVQYAEDLAVDTARGEEIVGS